MASPLEAEIASLLNEQVLERPAELALGAVAREFVSRWRKNILSPAEQIDCAQFLLNAGLHHTLLLEVQRMLQPTESGESSSAPHLPWGQFAESIADILMESGIPPDRSELLALLNTAERSEGLGELLRSYRFDELIPEFRERRSQLEAVQQSALDERKQALKEKQVYMRSQRMHEQELEVLDEIQAVFPNEPEMQEAKEAHQLRWARNIVSQSSASELTRDLSRKLQSRADHLDKAQLAQKDKLVERAQKMAEGEPHLAYDLAVALHMMEFHGEALHVLAVAPVTAAAEWLRLELLIHARQFVTALVDCDRLEISFADDPDTAFAVSYARARALRGLGQNDRAADILKSIVRLRPNYKSAQALLREWNEGEA